MPNGEQVPKSPKTPRTPKGKEFPDLDESVSKATGTTPSTKRERRKTLKEVFGMGGSDGKSVRKSKSKPDLRRRNSFDLEPVPPLPAAGRPGSPSVGRAGSPVPSSAAWPGGAPAPVSKTAVPEALAALTANASKDKPKVEVVPDVFAAFNSSTTSLINTSTVRRQTMKSPTGEDHPRVPSPLRESVEEAPSLPSVVRQSHEKPLPPMVTRGSDERQRPAPVIGWRSDERAPSPIVTRRSDERNQPSPVVTRRSDERRPPSPLVTRQSDERRYAAPTATVAPPSNEKPPPSFVVKGGAHTGGARMPSNQSHDEDLAARQRHAEALAALEGHGKKSRKERKSTNDDKEKKKNRTRSQSLSKRISMSVIGVFKRKKEDGEADDEDLPDVPALPAAYIKHSASTPSLHRGPPSMGGTASPESTWGRSTGAQVLAQLGGRSPDSTWGRSQGPPMQSAQNAAAQNGSIGSTTSLAKREKRLHNIQRIPPPRLNDDERLASANLASSNSGHSLSERSASPASVDVPNVTLPLKIVKQPSLSMKNKPVVMAKSPASVASPTSIEGIHSIPSEVIIHNEEDIASTPVKKLPQIPIKTESPVATEPPRVASPDLGSPTMGFDPMSPKTGSYKRLSKGMPAALAASAYRKRSIDGIPATQSPELAAQFRHLIQSASPPPVLSELPGEGALALSGLQLNTMSPVTSPVAEHSELSAVTPVFTTTPSLPPQIAPLQIHPLTPSRDSPTQSGTLSPSATPERHDSGDGEPLSPNTSLHSPGNSIHNIEVEVKTATRQSMIRSTSQPILAAVAAGSVVSFGSSGGSTLSRVPTNDDGTVESDTSTPTPSGFSSNDESPFFQRSTTSVDRAFPGGPPKYSSHIDEGDERALNKAAHEAKKASMSSNHVSRFSMDSTDSRASRVSADSVYSQRDSRISKDFEGFMPQAVVTREAPKSRHVSSFSVDSAMSTAALIADNDVSDSDSVASTPTKISPAQGPLAVHPVEMALADTSEVLLTPVGSDGGDMEQLTESKPESLSSRAASPSPSVASSVLLPSVKPTPAPQQTAASTASSLFAMISNSVTQASESVANAVTAVLGSDQNAATREASAKSPTASPVVSATRPPLPKVPEVREEKELPPSPKETEVMEKAQTQVAEKALPPSPSKSEEKEDKVDKELPASPERSEERAEAPSTPGPWQTIQSSESLDSVNSKGSSASNDIPETPTTTTSNSIYATPTSGMSPVRSTPSHRGSIIAYDSDDGVTRSQSQRRGSMPAALRATAIRRRTTSQPIASVVMSNQEPPNRLEFSSPEPGSGSPIGLGRPVVLRSASMPTQQLTESPRSLSAELTGPASVASSLPWLAKTPAVAEVEEVLESSSSTPTIDSASEVATIKGSVKDESPVVPAVTAFPDSKSSSGCNGGMTSPELSVESRVDSPLGFSLSGESEEATHAVEAPPAIDSFVVPFPPDAEHAPLGAMPRSPTVPANYTATASARERTRRDSGQNMRTVGGYTISRRPLTSNSDTSVNVIHPTPPSKQARQSLQTLPSAVEMDFSQRSSMGPTGPEFSLWLESTANSAPMEELEELTQSAGFQSAKYDQRVVYDSPASTISTASTSRPMRRPLPNPDDFRNGTASSPVRDNAYETSSLHSSSGSDDGPALCTPRTPDTAHLVSDFGTPSKAAIVGVSPAATGAKAEQISRGLPNRPMHVDMANDTEGEESFATAREGME